MLRRLFGMPTEAQSAGRKAGRAWKNILAHTDTDLDALLGRDAYTHACEEAERWLISYREARDPRRTGGYVNVHDVLKPANEHEMYLEYVEAFLKEIAPELRSSGQPKE